MKKKNFESALIYTSDAITPLLHATSCRPRGRTIAPDLRRNKKDAKFHRGTKEPTRRGLNASVPA